MTAIQSLTPAARLVKLQLGGARRRFSEHLAIFLHPILFFSWMMVQFSVASEVVASTGTQVLNAGQDGMWIDVLSLVPRVSVMVWACAADLCGREAFRFRFHDGPDNPQSDVVNYARCSIGSARILGFEALPRLRWREGNRYALL